MLPRQATEWPELTVVADSFHTKPLRHILQSTGRYQVLALSLHQVPLALTPDVPQTMTAALGDERTEPLTTVSSYRGVGGGHMALHHGHGGKKDQIDGDAERYFRAVNRAVLEHHSRPSVRTFGSRKAVDCSLST
jgi:hypothetical protein